MSLRTFVKISNVSNLSDARYCAGMGVDQLGFNFNPSVEDSISAELFSEISGWISGPQFVGEFDDLPADQVIDFQKDIALNVLEITNMDQVEKLNLLGKPISFKISVEHEAQLNELKGQLSYLDELVDQVVIHSSQAGLYNRLNEMASFYHGRLKLIKGFDLAPTEEIVVGNFHGIQLQGTPEDQPGYKDYGDVMDILESLEVD